MSKTPPQTRSGAIYELDGRPSFFQAFPLGLQQLLAMFVGNIVPMIMVAGAANMDAYHSTLLIQCSVLGAGVATLIQAFPIKLGKLRIGSGLPVMMGLTYTFLPICMAIATNAQLGLGGSLRRPADQLSELGLCGAAPA